jgi:hypothetical protein
MARPPRASLTTVHGASYDPNLGAGGAEQEIGGRYHVMSAISHTLFATRMLDVTGYNYASKKAHLPWI